MRQSAIEISYPMLVNDHILPGGGGGDSSPISLKLIVLITYILAVILHKDLPNKKGIFMIVLFLHE